MKKNLLAALLVAILASSMVFAGFTGSASAEFGWKIDDKAFGFDNLKGSKAVIELASATGESKGEGNVYAGIKASLTLKVEGKDLTGDQPVVATVKFTEAYVGGENWQVSLLGAMSNPNFAASYTVDPDTGKPVWNYNANPVEVAGLTITAFDYNIGVGLNRDYASVNKKDNNGALLTFKTPEYKLAEGLTLVAGAGAGVQSKDFKNGQFGWGAKVAYAQDKLSASAATDMGLAVVNGEAKFDTDVAAHVGYSPVALDVYFATKAKTVKNMLNAKVSVTLDEYVGMPLSFYVDLLDLVNDARTLEANVSTKLVEEKLTLGATYKTNMQKPLVWSIKANAGYNFDVASVEGDVTYASAKTLTFNFKASSDKLINNATLALTYKGLTFNFNDGAEHKYGNIVASCTVKF